MLSPLGKGFERPKIEILFQGGANALQIGSTSVAPSGYRPVSRELPQLSWFQCSLVAHPEE